MFDEADIRQSYSDDVETHTGHYFFQLHLAKTFYDYCLKSTADVDLLVISEAIVDRAFAMDVIRQASGDFSQDRVSRFDLTANPYGFTQALVLPNTYHGAFKGRFDAKRERLYLCVPIHRCEFSGDESANEFKAMLGRTVYPFRWNRPVSPKIRVYFDNPATGAGTDEEGVLMTYSTVLSEIDNLNGGRQRLYRDHELRGRGHRSAVPWAGPVHPDSPSPRGDGSVIATVEGRREPLRFRRAGEGADALAWRCRLRCVDGAMHDGLRVSMKQVKVHDPKLAERNLVRNAA